MDQRECAGYIITQSIMVKDSEFVLGEHPKKDMYVTWRCKDGDNYFWGHYMNERHQADRDLLERAKTELDLQDRRFGRTQKTKEKERER